MPLPENITLSSAKRSDIPTLGHIAGIAFESDTHTLLKAQFESSASHEEGMREGLENWFENPRCDIIVARERVEEEGAEGTIVGFVCWGRRGYEPTSTELPSTPLPDPGAAPRTIAGLKTLNGETMSHYVHRLMPPGARCRYMTALTVLPSHQGRGVGSALIKWGTARCDEEGVFCWVSSSMDGWPAFAKQGFEEVGRLEVDLDEFCEGKKRPGGGSWGRYVWRWTRREQQTGSGQVQVQV